MITRTATIALALVAALTGPAAAGTQDNYNYWASSLDYHDVWCPEAPTTWEFKASRALLLQSWMAGGNYKSAQAAVDAANKAVRKDFGANQKSWCAKVTGMITKAMAGYVQANALTKPGEPTQQQVAEERLAATWRLVAAANAKAQQELEDAKAAEAIRLKAEITKLEADANEALQRNIDVVYAMAGLPSAPYDPDVLFDSKESGELWDSLNRCASHVAWDYRCRAHVREVWAKYTRTFDTLDTLELPYRKGNK